jgi:DNA-binding GntR family transcriptional regulator
MKTVSVSRSSTSRPLQCDHGLRRQAIVQSLLTEVFEGRLRAGQHLVTQDLAVRFGVSHTPIREALIALAGIGVIDLLPNRGAVVRRVTTRDVREICQVRRVLECEAARSACGRIDHAVLRVLAADLKEFLAKPPTELNSILEQSRTLDSRLHDLIAASSGNQLLANELGRLKILFRVCRDMIYTYDTTRITSGRFLSEAGEHLAIVEALLASDRAAAVRAMSYHILKSLQHWGRVLPGTPVGRNSKPARDSADGRPSLREGTNKKSEVP